MRDCLFIALTWSAPLVILSPFQDTPFVDDWVYAWPVEWLLRYRELRILEYSGSVNLAQVLWGTIFCLPRGFSFTALRISTWVAALGCLWALYLLLRDLEVPRRAALLATAALGLNPIFFMLSFTFMTDVPYLALMVWSVLAMARAIRAESTGWLLASSVLTCLAIGVRVVGVVLPVAMACVLLLHAGKWGRHAGRLVIALSPLLFCVYLAWWRRNHLFVSADMTWVDGNPETHMKDLRRYAMPLFPVMLVNALAFAAGHVGIALLPLTVSSLRRRLVPWSLAIFAGLSLLLAVSHWAGIGYHLPLVPGETWGLFELGPTQNYVPGYREPLIPRWICWAALVLGWWSSSVLAAAWLLQRPRGDGRIGFLTWLILGNVLLMAGLWLIYDRYAFVFFPIGIALLLSCRAEPRLVLSLIVLTAFGVVSLVGLRDHLHYNAALWHAVDSLRRRGVPDSQINGGYAVNGWLQYAHPENAHRDDEGKITIPQVNVGGTLEYQVANSILPSSRVVERIPYRRLWHESGTIYILERDPALGQGVLSDEGSEQ